VNNYFKHESVLFNEVLEYLNYRERENKYYADFTFGGGGHSLALARDVGCEKIFCFDQDPEAYNNGFKKIAQEGLEKKIKLINKNFSYFEESVPKEVMFEGILMDLGVSSHHFDSAERGFSFRFDGPLDMRMNISDDSISTAADLVNDLSCEELVDIFQKYGEEKFSKRIAETICEKRSTRRIQTTGELEDIIFHCYPKKLRHTGKSPSTKTFQALRIAVNDELGVLEKALAQSLPRLCLGGRIAVITFHSLEDRIVKQTFKDIQKNSDIPYEILTKKPVIPTQDEIVKNSRSRSAKLRVIQRVEKKRTKNKYPRDLTSK